MRFVNPALSPRPVVELGKAIPVKSFCLTAKKHQYTPNSDGTATSFINSDGSTGVAYPDGSVQMNPTISSYWKQQAFVASLRSVLSYGDFFANLSLTAG